MEQMECKICKNVTGYDDNTVTLRQLVADGVNEASKLKNDAIQLEKGNVVTIDGRKRYLKKKKSADQKAQTSSTRSRSKFDFRSNCYLCGTKVIVLNVKSINK